MALDKRLLDILCCPVTRQPLQVLSARQLERVRQAQQAGELRHADGSAAEDAIDGGLLTRDGKTIYPLVDGIPVMLADQAISTSQFEAFPDR